MILHNAETLEKAIDGVRENVKKLKFSPGLLEKIEAKWDSIFAMADSDAAEKGPDLAPDSVSGRVDNVISDLLAGRVMPKKVDELGKAVERTRQGYAVGKKW
jgi:hypothetical protein